MGSRTSPNKVLLDIKDCVFQLKKESIDGKNPINDDCMTLHRLQEKLELLLMFGLLEKPGILGPKKTYWNYICACFISLKRNHDGISYVKSIIHLKTSLGRGRAFIRFCLTQKCLADTLQSCFMDEKVSRDYYSEHSLIMQEKLWSSLVASLYDLNELNFDLSAGYTELDISWPKFSRKLFVPLETENFSYKDMQASSVNSSYSQGNLDVPKLVEQNEELCQQNQYLQGKVQCLEEEKLNLQSDIQKLQAHCLVLQQQVMIQYKESSNGVLESQLIGPSSFSISEIKENYLNTDINTDHSTIASKCNENHSQTELSVKQNIKEDLSENYSECAMQQRDNDIIEASDECCKNVDDLEMINIDLPSNNFYLSEILLEFKTVIDDIEDVLSKSEVTIAAPHISRLRRIRTCLEETVSNYTQKSKAYLNFNNFVENCVSCIKDFAVKQENLTNSLLEKIDLSISQNQKLHSRMITLKDLLRSYGFLKFSNEKDIESKNILLPFDINSVIPSTSDCMSFQNIAYDPILKRVIVPLIPVLNSMFSKLNDLNGKIVNLQIGLDYSQELNNNLISRVQDQKIHLKGVTKELEEAQHLVSVLKKQHKKLQSAEGIFKYDLQEKRKLLTRLKQQLENTRENCNLVRIKNSKSEAEWHDLRKEFIQRHKQTSEESGFVDDKGFEECESTFSNSRCSSSFSEEVIENTSVNNASLIPSKINLEEPRKKSRLDLLEEQCQNLYSSLLQSSKKHNDIDMRLEVMCKNIKKTNNEIIHTSTPTNNLKSADFINLTNISANNSSEDICQNVIFTSDNITISPHSSLDVGSLNSECSSCIPGICNDANSTDDYCCDSSKANSCISLLPLDFEIDAIQVLSTIEQSNENDSFVDSEPTYHNIESKDDMVMCSSCDSVEMCDSTVQSTQLPNLLLSHVDSLLIKKKDLEESLKILEIGSELSSNKIGYLESGDFAKQILALEEERRCLLNKVHELEKKNLMLSTELDNVTQQLILSKSSKEHEVSALQFQLNTESLKYERTIKDFTEQNKGLESMKQRVTEQEDLILALEEALTEIRVDRENETELQWQELEDIHIALEAREQECDALFQDLEKSMADVENERNRNELLLSQLQELKEYSQKDKESIEAELVDLRTVSRELKKKLVKLLKEKDLLWKRSTHLYHLQKVKINDRWMNDSEVSSCLGCKNNFSFMLRKHHCRLCGRIFCYSCSNNWLLTASSRKKLRACNECFMQYIEIKKDVRKGSGVPEVDESEDEEHNVNLSFIPTSSCSLNSEVPLSIANSISSLPMTQKQNTPRFASAPDLRYVIQGDEISCSVSLVEESILEESEKDKKNQVIYDEFSEELDVELNRQLNEGEICSAESLEDASKTIRLKEIFIAEIKALEHGLSSEFIIDSGIQVDLPVFCQFCPILLKWCFIPDCQDIPMTITRETGDDEPLLISQNEHKMEDEIELSIPGYYVFHFDNSFRDTELKMKYNFLTKSMSQVKESSHQKQ